jgi:integrase
MKHTRLPPSLHYKHGRYYYVKANRWTPLSRDYHDALIQYAGIVKPGGGGIGELLDRFIVEVKPAIRPNTLKSYLQAIEKLKKALVEFAPNQLKPVHVAQLLDHYRATPGVANVMRNVLKQAFTKAILWGLAETNPAQFVPPLKTGKRGRYLTHAEYQAIRASATPTLQSIIDVLYLTGQRIGDVLKLRHSDIDADGIFFRQEKTGNRLRIAMSDDLRAALSAARALHVHGAVKGLTLFHNRQGRPLSYQTVRTLWSRAVKSAGVHDAHLHDLRAKAGTDAKAQGLDSKTLLGHTSESAHSRYLRSKEIPVAQPVKIRKS